MRVAAIASLPKTPDTVLGVINIQGRAAPVINMRQRFCLPQCEIALSAMPDESCASRATCDNGHTALEWVATRTNVRISSDLNTPDGRVVESCVTGRTAL